MIIHTPAPSVYELSQTTAFETAAGRVRVSAFGEEIAKKARPEARKMPQRIAASPASTAQTAPDKLLFRLYVTRGERASKRALVNLRTICREHLSNYEIEVVDVREHPRRAKRDGVTATPVLIKRSPTPTWRMAGDLNEDALILSAMQRKGTARRLT